VEFPGSCRPIDTSCHSGISTRATYYSIFIAIGSLVIKLCAKVHEDKIMYPMVAPLIVVNDIGGSYLQQAPVPCDSLITVISNYQIDSLIVCNLLLAKGL